MAHYPILHINISIIYTESRWDPPPGGYVSIAEQEEVASKKDKVVFKKAKVSQLIHVMLAVGFS